MSYGLIYTIPFSSNKGIFYQVNIEKEDYTGNSTELQGASQPFTIEIDEPDNDFRYAPMIGSTAKLKIVGSDYLQNLYSSDYQQYRVTLLKNNTVVWCGFIKPENYTQDYANSLFELDIDCISPINILQYIQYTQQGADERIFVSFWDLFKMLLTELKSNYQAVYIPHVYADNAADYKSYDNVLAKMKVSEQNFFTKANDSDSTPTTDESTGTTSADTSTEEAWKLSDVLENICRFLNWTCVDWDGSLYFIDPDFKGEYLKYTTDLSNYTIVSFPAALNVQSLGFAGSENTLDILPGYNKITIKDVNNNVGDIFPVQTWNVTFKYNSLSFGDIIPAPLLAYSNPGTYTGTEYLMIKVVQPNDSFKTYDYSVQNTDINGNITPVFLGSTLSRICSFSYDYKTKKYSITSVDFDNCIAIAIKNMGVKDRTTYNTYSLDSEKPVLSFNNKFPCIPYNGIISITGEVAQSIAEIMTGSKDIDGESKPMNLIFKLSINGQFWNGSTWQTTDTTFKVPITPDSGSAGFISIDNSSTLFSPYKNNTGYMIPLPDEGIYGTMVLQMYTPDCDDNIEWVYIKDLSITIERIGLETSDENYDRIYINNTLDYRFTHELDEIDLKICSDNGDGVCYSKVVLNDTLLTNNLYSALDEADIRPEEKLINRIINFYSAIKIKLTQVINESDSITPLSTFTDSYMTNKVFSMFCGSIDFEDDSFSVIMLEQ